MNKHSPIPWKLCGEDGKHFCGHIWSTDGNSHIVTVISGKWGDDYASLRFVSGSPSLHLTVEAFMDQITYGEIPEDIAEANARFIVTACNCYEKLVQALEEHSIYFLATNGEELFDQPLNWEAILLQEIREAEDQFNAS